MTNARYVAAAILCSVIAASIFVSCGGGWGSTGASVSSGGSNGSLSMSFRWPDGFTYGPETQAIYGPGDPRAAQAPDYVATATLTITGEGLSEPLVYTIPLDTMTVHFLLPPGPKTFTVTVTTIYGQTFTASATGDVSIDINLNITFELTVNAPPQIVEISGGSGTKGAGAPVSVTATDPDGNPLSYSWSAPGASVSGGASATVTSSNAGTYTVTVTVSDGHDGGTATASTTVTLTNQPPSANEITHTPAAPTNVDNITLTCDGSDPDNESLSYDWSGAVTGSGQTITFAPGAAGTYSFTCTVTDNDGESSSVSTTITVVSAGEPRTLNGTVGDVDNFDEFTIDEPATGTTYSITCTSDKASGNNTTFKVNSAGYLGGACPNNGVNYDTGTVSVSGASVTLTFPSGNGTYYLWIKQPQSGCTSACGSNTYSCTWSSVPSAGQHIRTVNDTSSTC